MEVSVFRGLGALAILVPMWWWQDTTAIRWSIREIGILSALGFSVLCNHLSVLYGLQYIGAGAAGIIIGAGPTITALLSSLLTKDIPFRRVWLGCLISFGGVACVSGMKPDDSMGENPLLGSVCILFALTSWALHTIGCRQVMARLSPLTVNWTTLLISIILQLPLLWTDHKVLATGISAIPVSGWIALLYAIVFATAIGQQAWLYGVSGIGAARAGVFVNLIPVSALLLSVLILAEPLYIWDILGIGLILLGVWQVNKSLSV